MCVCVVWCVCVCVCGGGACVCAHPHIHIYVWLTLGCKLHCRILQYSDHSSCEGAHMQLLSSEHSLTNYSHNLALPGTVNNQKEMLDFKNDTGNLLFVPCFHGIIPEFGCPCHLNMPSQESIQIVL